MSRQISIDTYFKTKSTLNPSGVKIMNENISEAKKRRSLSLTKTPTILKSPKYANCGGQSVIKKEPEVKCLSSDDENALSPAEATQNLNQNSIKSYNSDSDSSQATVIYTLTPQTPVKSPQKTPLKNPQTSSSNSFQSPNSPTKKGNVIKRTPVKRILPSDFSRPQLWLSYARSVSFPDDDLFNNACEGMDDKTIFFLTMVKNYLKDDTISELLMQRSQYELTRCFQVSKPGMRLICRLYWRRQRCWYRKDQLMQISGRKNEVIDEPTFQEMITSLKSNGFICTDGIIGDTAMNFDDFAKVLKANEIKQICKDLKLKIQSKQDGIKALRAFQRRSSISQYFTGGTPVSNVHRVLVMMRTIVGTCYRLYCSSTFYRLYQLMYLGMNYAVIRDKQLELMLLNDKVNRETYPIDKKMDLDSPSIVFRSRDEFTEYHYAHTEYEIFLSAADTDGKCNRVIIVYKKYKKITPEAMMRYKTLPEWLRRFTPPYHFVKILDLGVQELKKDKTGLHYQLALDILTMLIGQAAFRSHRKADWYAEKALILHKLLSRHDDAAKTLLEGLKSSIPEEMKDAMRPRAIKLAKQQNIEVDPTLRAMLIKHASKDLILESHFPADHVSKQSMENYKQRGKKKFEIHTVDEKKFLDCEEYCIIHYTTNEPFTHGGHWEGRIVTTIFYLLFWDIIYTKPVGVTGVFLSYYQLHPLDMFTESFYVNRKAVIDERLSRIESMAFNTLVETMQEKWEERPEHELSGINRSIGWDNIRMVAGCLGAKATGAICRRLAVNYGRAHSAFPDLTLWNAATKKIKFVEVKTDTDKPSLKQLQWMQYLTENGIDTGFCYVGANTTRCKARREPPPKSLRDSIIFESSPP